MSRLLTGGPIHLAGDAWFPPPRVKSPRAGGHPPTGGAPTTGCVTPVVGSAATPLGGGLPGRRVAPVGPGAGGPVFSPNRALGWRSAHRAGAGHPRFARDLD